MPTEGVGANRVMWKRHREQLSTRTEKSTDLGLQASQVGAGKGRRRQQLRHVARGLEQPLPVIAQHLHVCIYES